MKWDPTTRQFGANEEEWASYIQANPDAALLRYKAFEHTDQLEIIFSGVAGQGEAEVSEHPTRRRKHDKNTLITNLSDVEPKDVEPERIEPLCEAVESRPQNEHPDKGERQLDVVESTSCDSPIYSRGTNLQHWRMHRVLGWYTGGRTRKRSLFVCFGHFSEERIQGDLFAVEEVKCENRMVETTAISRHAAIMFVLQDDLATR